MVDLIPIQVTTAPKPENPHGDSGQYVLNVRYVVSIDGDNFSGVVGDGQTEVNVDADSQLGKNLAEVWKGLHRLMLDRVGIDLPDKVQLDEDPL